jgi:hypothetical protein
MENREFIERVAQNIDDWSSYTSVIVSINPEIESEEIKNVCSRPGSKLVVPWIVFMN